jgi:hypothetical protein
MLGNVNVPDIRKEQSHKSHKERNDHDQRTRIAHDCNFLSASSYGAHPPHLVLLATKFYRITTVLHASFHAATSFCANGSALRA